MSSTTSWGAHLWKALFTTALNHHFMTSTTKDEDHCRFFSALGPVLPCSYCVAYYDKIYQEMPLEADLKEARITGRPYSCLYWLYKVKDRVNQKLIKQEQECFMTKLEEIYKRTDLTEQEKFQQGQQLEEKIMYTQPSPPFSEVVALYMSTRSDCRKPINQQLLSCRHIPE